MAAAAAGCAAPAGNAAAAAAAAANRGQTGSELLTRTGPAQAVSSAAASQARS